MGNFGISVGSIVPVVFQRAGRRVIFHGAYVIGRGGCEAVILFGVERSYFGLVRVARVRDRAYALFAGTVD